MARIQNAQYEIPYAQINKTGLNDPNLTLGARGLLAQMLAKPPEWKIQKNELLKHTSSGKTELESALHNLLLNGYIYYYQEKDEKGTFGEWVYLIFQTPEANPYLEESKAKGEALIAAKKARNKKKNDARKPKADNPKAAEKPKTDNPKADNPPPDIPTSDNPTLNNKDFSNKDFSNNDFSDIDLKDLERERKKITDISKNGNIDPRFINLLHERLEDLIESEVDLITVGRWLKQKRTLENPAYITAFVINQLADSINPLKDTANYIESTLNMSEELLQKKAKAAAKKQEKQYQQRIKDKKAAGDEYKRPVYNWLEV